MMIFGFIPLKRFLFYLILSYIIWYGSSLLFFAFWITTNEPIILFAGQISTPIILLFFSWLYFRNVERNDWTARAATCALWLGASLFVSFLLVKPVYGASWTSTLTSGLLIGQAVNYVGLLVGGYAAQRKMHLLGANLLEGTDEKR